MQRCRIWTLVCAFLAVPHIAVAAADDAPQVATLILHGGTDRLYPVVAQGSGTVKWSHGAFIFNSGPYFFTMNTEGDLIAKARLDMPDDAHYFIEDYDRRGDGTIVVAAVPDFDDVSPFLAWIAPDGKTERLKRTAPYHPRELTFAQDGTVWTLGYEMIDRQLKDPRLDPKAGVLRQFDRGGKTIAVALPQEDFLKTKEIGRLEFGRLVAVRGRLGWYSSVGGDSRYVEIPTDKIEMHVFPGVPRELSGNKRWDGDLEGLAVTDSGNVAVSIGAVRSRRTFVFDRTSKKWMKLAVPAMGNVIGYDPWLVGSDGDRLVFSEGVQAGFFDLNQTANTNDP